MPDKYCITTYIPVAIEDAWALAALAHLPPTF